jgi:hypothetical protein
MNRFISINSRARQPRFSLAHLAMVAAVFSASAWAQEPIPKNLSPVPEARFFETQPVVGAPLTPAYRAGPPSAAASAVQPGIPVARVKAISHVLPATQRSVGTPLAADGGTARSQPCDTLLGEARQKCVERTSP